MINIMTLCMLLQRTEEYDNIRCLLNYGKPLTHFFHFLAIRFSDGAQRPETWTK